MQKLYQKSEIWFAIGWIIIYVIGTSVADSVSDTVGTEKSITLIWLLLLCVVALRWLKRQDLYEKYGLWAAALFRGAWSYVSVFIVGFGAVNAAGSVYALYGVSETWLTGGDGGMIYGVLMTAVLIGMAVWMERKALAKVRIHPLCRKKS